MTDFRTIVNQKKAKNDSNKKEEFFNNVKYHSVNESAQGTVSQDQESEQLVSSFREITNKYRPDISIRQPETFAFFGSAKKYYEDSFYNIVNYYPYDGTKKEILKWFSDSSPVDVGLLQSEWPSFVGHLNFNSSQKVDFYSGPQSIPESTYMGNVSHGETGLSLDASHGNTVEFWLKKEDFSAPKEIIFDIGTYPGKIDSSKMGQFRMFLSNSSGSPIYVDYSSGSNGVSAKNIGSSALTTSSVGDGKWHHYALRVNHHGNDLNLILYVDGEFDSKTVATSIPKLSKVDTYMGGCIGGNQADSTGTLSGSLDEFRFWKGLRTPRQISRFFDQKIFASETSSELYTSRLGLYYRFNKPSASNLTKDIVVVDYSGNDITGKILNYSTDTRVATSAITNSSASVNTELKDPCLDSEHSDVSALKLKLLNIGENYDNNNSSNIKNFVPEWVFDADGQGLSNADSQVSILFHLISSEFDNIRMYLNSISNEKSPTYRADALTLYDQIGDISDAGVQEVPVTNYFIGCDDEGEVYVPVIGYHSTYSTEKLEDVGIKVELRPLINATLNDELDNIVEHVSITRPVEEIRRSILNNIYSQARQILKKKGTERGFDNILSSYGTDRNLISYNIYGKNAETFIDNASLDSISEESNSINFLQNRQATIYLSGASSIEKTFLAADSTETDYTFAGTFIFPKTSNTNYEIQESSIFGFAEVSATNNKLTFESPNNADFQISVVKSSTGTKDAKFKLSSTSGIISAIETEVFKDVYDNSRWHLAVRFTKQVDNKFLNISSPAYKIELIGHNYVLDNLQNSFHISSNLTSTQYTNFRQADKTFFIGAQRSNITGSVLKESDIKVVNFNGWNDDLSIEEMQFMAQNPSVNGRSSYHLFRDNHSTKNIPILQSSIFSIQFDGVSSLTLNNDIIVQDSTSGSAEQIQKYGVLIGSKYNVKSTQFSSNLDNVLQKEFLPIVRNIPLGNVHGEQGVKLKDSEINKFDLSSRPEGKIFSFEKSMYQAISREMIEFLGGMKSFNNLIGEPIYKYRKNYKMLEHVRQKFYETVENESQFERFVSYFRWIDKSLGKFLEQLVPATATANAGIEEVVESHTLERNKYQHKAPLVERKEYDSGLEANLLAINELLYDWEHGHAEDDENKHCLWQKDRKERTGDREALRKVLTTVVPGSTYITRNLVKPYRHDVDRQTLLSIGSNRNANKNKELYKIVNQGKEIVINASDIYEFKECKDILEPQKEKLYTAKTNTTSTDGYLDADADMILPFSLYSSSVGVDFHNFKQKLKITNNHDGNGSLQSPHIRSLAMGMPHRSVKIGTPKESRPEAYEISSSATKLVIKSSSGPKSMFNRNLGGSIFYNIANIKTRQNPLIIGNYLKEYEIIMTNGRSINNNYLVEFEGLNLTGGISTSSFLPGIVDFTVPERPIRDHVVVNRFSSPGSPESSGMFGLDRESSEYSIYNTVNYRNLGVRNVENVLSSEPSSKFGFRSSSATQASKHKTNRNLRRFTGSLGQQIVHDNNFIQHEIPQNDFGYGWITASTNESVYSFLNKNENTGHQHLMNISGSLKSSETISFLTSSTGDNNTIIDFAGLNTNIGRSLDISTNILDQEIQKAISFDSETTGQIPTGWRENQHNEEHQVPGQYVRENSEDATQKILAFSGWYDPHANGSGLNLPPGTVADNFRWAEYTAQGFETPIRISFEYILGSDDPGLSQNFGLINKPEQEDKMYLQYKVGTGGTYSTILTIGDSGNSNSVHQSFSSDTFHTAEAFIKKESDKVYLRWVVGTAASRNADHWGIRNIIIYNTTNLRDLLNNRHGPYGWPSWKQIRNEQHPISRQHKKNNKLSVVYKKSANNRQALISSVKGNYKFDYKNTFSNNTVYSSPRQVANYDEMFVTSKFNPLNVNLTSFNAQMANLESLSNVLHISDQIKARMYQFSHHLMWFNDEYYLSSVGRDLEDYRTGISSGEDLFVFLSSNDDINSDMTKVFQDTLRDSTNVSMKASVQNKISGFAQREISDLKISGVSNVDLWTKYINKEAFGSEPNLAILKNYLSDGLRNGLMRELSYIETIYPREINTYKSNVRQRHQFKFFGWNSNRASRSLILTGNVSYESALINFTTLPNPSLSLFFPANATSKERVFKKSYYDNIEIIDVNSTGSSASLASSRHITASKWVLDSRSNFTTKPIDIKQSYFNNGNAFLSARSQGTRGEGILQNDYSIFPLGYNGLRGAPPLAPVYNRRIPQSHNTSVYLSGEALWEASSGSTGPFYDDYSDFADGLKTVGQTYSLLPEYRISDIYENFAISRNVSDLVPNEFLEITGAVYHTSSGNLSVGKQFFETYSMTDFMKYFQPVRENMEEEMALSPGRLTLRCQAVKRFLPYRGFYPAERVVQISEIFNRHYLQESSYNAEYINNAGITEQNALKFLNLRIQNSKAQVIKPLLAPGVLLNSIKAGLAVDYPIFSSSVSSGVDHIFTNVITASLDNFSSLSLGASTCFTGSIINSSVDSGVPRISGSVSTRITFDDLLDTTRIWDKIIYDNEPHPSASLMYGTAEHLKVLDRPSRFGTVDKLATSQYGAVDFSTNRINLKDSLYPFEDAVNNFCAETVNFFLEGAKVQTAMSSPQPQHFEAAPYKMKVYITNNNTMMYDRHSAFGPPVDDGSPQVTKFELQDTTVVGVPATASIKVNTNKLPHSSRKGKTITIRDYKSNASVYEFTTDVEGVAASGTVGVPNANTLCVTGRSTGGAYTVPNHDTHGGNITYRFVRNTIGATATGSVDFTSLTPSNSTGGTVTLPDFDANNTKTYEFIQDTPAVAATSSIGFSNIHLTHSMHPLSGATWSNFPYRNQLPIENATLHLTSSNGTKHAFIFKQQHVGGKAMSMFETTTSGSSNEAITFHSCLSCIGNTSSPIVPFLTGTHLDVNVSYNLLKNTGANGTLGTSGYHGFTSPPSSEVEVYKDFDLTNMQYKGWRPFGHMGLPSFGDDRQQAFINLSDAELARWRFHFGSHQTFGNIAKIMLSASINGAQDQAPGIEITAENKIQKIFFFSQKPPANAQPGDPIVGHTTIDFPMQFHNGSGTTSDAIFFNLSAWDHTFFSERFGKGINGCLNWAFGQQGDINEEMSFAEVGTAFGVSNSWGKLPIVTGTMNPDISRLFMYTTTDPVHTLSHSTASERGWRTGSIGNPSRCGNLIARWRNYRQTLLLPAPINTINPDPIYNYAVRVVKIDSLPPSSSATGHIAHTCFNAYQHSSSFAMPNSSTTNGCSVALMEITTGSNSSFTVSNDWRYPEPFWTYAVEFQDWAGSSLGPGQTKMTSSYKWNEYVSRVNAGLTTDTNAGTTRPKTFMFITTSFSASNHLTSAVNPGVWTTSIDDQLSGNLAVMRQRLLDVVEWHPSGKGHTMGFTLTGSEGNDAIDHNQNRIAGNTFGAGFEYHASAIGPSAFTSESLTRGIFGDNALGNSTMGPTHRFGNAIPDFARSFTDNGVSDPVGRHPITHANGSILGIRRVIAYGNDADIFPDPGQSHLGRCATPEQLAQSASHAIDANFTGANDIITNIDGTSVHLTQSVAGASGNTRIRSTTFISSGGSIESQLSLGGFFGGADAVDFTNGTQIGGGNTNIAVNISSGDNAAALKTAFQSAVSTAQSGEFTFSSDNNKLIISMATTDTATSQTRNITATGDSDLTSAVAGFSTGVPPLTFTSGQRVDAGAGWPGGTDTDIAIVVGTKTTYANTSTDITQTNIALALSGAIKDNNTGVVPVAQTNTVLLEQVLTGTGGNNSISFANANSSALSSGMVSGFSGGIDALDRTTGTQIGGGNTNIAVVIGRENVGGTPGNNSMASHTQVRDRLKLAIEAVQGVNISASSVDATHPTVNLTQRGTGSAGNLPITDSGFVHGNPSNDILGFDGGVDFVQGTMELRPTSSIQEDSHGFLPYIPPFLDPNTSPYAELTFTPSSEGEYSIPEILDKLTITYHNMEAPSNAATNTNYKEAMVLSASVNLKKFVKLQSDHLAEDGDGVKVVSDVNTSDLFRWVIQPKWETPILDFSNASASALNLSDNTVQKLSGSPWKTRYQSDYYTIQNSSSIPYLTASTGMWHQSGNIISDYDTKGLHMVIESGDPSNPDRFGARCLATKVGFLSTEETTRNYKLGQPAESKEVAEAVVAIPFYNDPENGITFFPIGEENYAAAIRVNEQARDFIKSKLMMSLGDELNHEMHLQSYKSFYNSPGSTGHLNVAYQLRMMEKFVIPPQFDFMLKDIDCAAVEPFVQYIFQFRTDFTQEDLVNMWQNKYPVSETSAATAKHSTPFPGGHERSYDTEYISNFLNVKDTVLFRTKHSNYENVEQFLQNEVRWLVFKAKQRAISDYQEIFENSISDGVPENIFSINSIEGSLYGKTNTAGNIDGRKKRTNIPGFNWPYDYFSLVELGKLESKIDFYDNSLVMRSPEKYPSRDKAGGADIGPEAEIYDRRNYPASSGLADSVDILSGAPTSVNSPTAGSIVADSMVFREILLTSKETPTSRVFNVNRPITPGTEQVFLNGVLQTQGAGNDYVISGQSITFNFDLDSGDDIAISYVKR